MRSELSSLEGAKAHHAADLNLHALIDMMRHDRLIINDFSRANLALAAADFMLVNFRIGICLLAVNTLDGGFV